MLRSSWLALFASLSGTLLGVQGHKNTFHNPVLYEDFPDNDVSVGPDGAFYFSASNFHYSPGAPILRSYDLINWEHVGHSIPRLDFGSGYDLPPTGERAYRAGTWASTLRYRKSNGLWYWIGCTNFWNTWIYTAPDPEGPWSRAAQLPGGTCYYDLGLLIDDDDTMYVVYTHNGGAQVNVTQLSPDGLSPVRTEGVLWPGQVGAESVEGNRLYKMHGLYYILNDHPGTTAYVWKSSTPWGPYEGRALADNVASPLPGGGAPHQGSLIQTRPGGDWYFMSFTWAYPSGRLPVLAPLSFPKGDFPSLLPNSTTWSTSYPYPLPPKPFPPSKSRWIPQQHQSYHFPSLSALPPTFEWNHNPDLSNVSFSRRGLVLRTATLTDDLYSARNTLTHRVHGEFPRGTVELDISGMKVGDRAGLAAFRDQSAYIGVHKTVDGETTKEVVKVVAKFGMVLDEWGSGKTLDMGEVVGEMDVTGPIGKNNGRVWLRVGMDARPNGNKEAKFEYSLDGRRFTQVGPAYQLYTGWAFFLGYRFGIFNFATQELGGEVDVVRFATD